jgi:hypothetical protein
MLNYLKLTNIGPAPEFFIPRFGSRLNMVTGDNGLGKSFLLDSAWWALTRKWPAEINTGLVGGKKAIPYANKSASIEFSFTSKTGSEIYTSSFDRESQAWTGRSGRPANPGLILYAMADGSFALWDPDRNYWKKKGSIDVQDRPPAYVFTPDQVWNGLGGEKGTMVCNGLIQDWAGWQKENGRAFKTLCAVLTTLSANETECLNPGELTRISLDDVRDMPTLRLSYGQSVPVVHASAGMRRIIALAYFMVWAWEEHQKAVQILGTAPIEQMVFLIDEIESHLHPTWQKKIIPALVHVVKNLSTEMQAQILAVTHSPLIMTSVEPLFDPSVDAWYDIDLVEANVELKEKKFRKHGDILNWLTSDAFDQNSGRAIEYETLIAEANRLVAPMERIDQKAILLMNARLNDSLGPLDPYLIRWRAICDKKGIVLP